MRSTKISKDDLQTGGILPPGSDGLIRADHGCLVPIDFDPNRNIGEVHIVIPSKEDMDKFAKKVRDLCEEHRNA